MTPDVLQKGKSLFTTNQYYPESAVLYLALMEKERYTAYTYTQKLYLWYSFIKDSIGS